MSDEFLWIIIVWGALGITLILDLLAIIQMIRTIFNRTQENIDRLARFRTSRHYDWRRFNAKTQPFTAKEAFLRASAFIFVITMIVGICIFFLTDSYLG